MLTSVDGNAQPDGAAVLLRVDRVAAHERRALAQPVALDHRPAGRLLPLVGDQALHRHAARQRELERAGVDVTEVRRVGQRPVQRIDADDHGKRRLLQLGDEGRQVARVGDQHEARAPLAGQRERHGQREHVIERQRHHHDLGAFLEHGADPRRRLLDVGDHVAVREHRPLGHAGRAARVLQERDVLLRQRNRIERQAAPGGKRGVPGDGAFDPPRRHELLAVLDHQVGEQALQRREQVADLGGDHVLDRGARDHLLHRVREVLEHDDRLRARVLELVLELAPGVERIAVDDRQPGAEGAEQRDRILQHVRQHDRQAVALDEAAALLQVGREVPRQAVDLGVGERRPQAAERRQVAKARVGLGVQLGKRCVGARVDLVRNARRIVLQPDLVHGSPSDCRSPPAGLERDHDPCPCSAPRAGE